MNDLSTNIEIALIDPRWSWRSVVLDGAEHLVVTLHHPYHGPIHSIVALPAAETLGKWLTDAVAGLREAAKPKEPTPVV